MEGRHKPVVAKHTQSTAYQLCGSFIGYNSRYNLCSQMMAWTINLKESVIDDLRWFGRKNGRLLLREAERWLTTDPLAETRNMKKLRANPIAHRELRLFGKYRVLYNVAEEAHQVTIVLVGEKRGNSLIVQGKEFTEHESHTPE